MVELKIRKFWQFTRRCSAERGYQSLADQRCERVFLIEAGDGDYRLTPYDPAFEKKWRRRQKLWLAIGTLCTPWPSEK